MLSTNLNIVRKNPYKLKFIEQTNELCLEAVKQKGNSLYYIKEQTPEICLEAVKQNGRVLSYVNEQTKEICLEAVKQYSRALCHVKKQTSEICLVAIKNNINSLKFVNIKYIKPIYKYLKSINFKNLHDNYKFIINKNLNDFKGYYKFDKSINGWGIKYLKQDLSLCKSVAKDTKYLSYINYKKLKLCLQIIKTFKKGFQYINKQYIEVLL